MKRGFTLIEILATITIATLLVTPVLRMMDFGTRGVYKGAERTTAILAAADVIEAIRGIEFSVIPPRPPDQFYSLSEIRELVNQHLKRNLPFFNQYEDKYLIGVAISEIRPEIDRNPAEPSALRLVAVQIMWKNGDGGRGVHFPEFHDDQQSQRMKKHKGFTLIEMLIAFAIAMFILTVFYLMYGTYQNRLIKVIQKSQGQQAVRLLSTKMRQELKAAIGVTNPNAEMGTSDAIRIELGTYHGYEKYSIEYRYEKEKRAIRFIERSDNAVVREGIFLGGQTQILGFFANSNDVNQQILTQKHRVDISIEYFDTVQTRKVGNQELVKPQAALITVYPRHTNMLLRIDVPQG